MKSGQPRDRGAKGQALELTLLGGFELRLGDGARLELSSKKAKALLACLALSLGRPLSRGKIAALLWPLSAEDQARTSLRQTLAVLRRVLGEPSDRMMISSAEGLSLDPTAVTVDVIAFEACLAEGGRAHLAQAVEIYRGQMLDGLDVRADPFEEWLRDERARLSALAAGAIEQLMALREDEGEPEAALLLARRLLSLDPLREDAHRAAMRLLQGQKRWNEALKQYGDCAECLGSELGLEPQEETQALYREILRQRDALEQHQRDRSPSRRRTRAAGRATFPHDEGKPSIAVLPFDNLSGDPDQSNFTDGITEDIITELSRCPQLFVIARNTTFTYKDRAVTIQEVHGDLGVGYVVEGSVRRAGRRVRVSAQLIEAASGKHVWAERYDRELTDIFDLQDELTRGIVALLPGRVESFEARRIARRPPEDMAAYELLLAGKIHHHRFTKQDNLEALDLMDRAIALDPGYAAAWAWKACLLGQALGRGFLPDPKALFKGALAAVEKALSLDQNEVEGHRILGEISMETHDLAKAQRHNERALALNPNDPRLAAQKGELATWLGDAEAGAGWVREAMRLDPYSAPVWAHLLGRALMHLGRYDEAIEAYGKSDFPRFGTHADMAGCYGLLGMKDEAGGQVARTLELKPGFSRAGYLLKLPYAHQQDRDRHGELLGAAPLPP